MYYGCFIKSSNKNVLSNLITIILTLNNFTVQIGHKFYYKIRRYNKKNICERRVCTRWKLI